MSTLEVNSLQHLDASANNLDLDSSGNATVNGNMTATEFYGGGGNLTGVGVDGIVSTANATAITITSAEHVGIGTTSPAYKLDTAIAGNWGHRIGTAGGTQVRISDNTIQGFSNDTTGGKLVMQSNGGNLGIVQQNPAKTLDVTGEIRASGGILFGSDTAAANTLDDYEEGTWTPSIAGTSSSGSYSYLARTGHYTRIGNIVHLMCSMTNITGTQGTGYAKITGLPYDVGSVSQSEAPVGVLHISTTGWSNNRHPYAWGTGAQLRLSLSDDQWNARTFIDITDVNSNADIGISITYRTDA